MKRGVESGTRLKDRSRAALKRKILHVCVCVCLPIRLHTFVNLHTSILTII